MNETNHVLVGHVLDRCLGIVQRLVAIGVEEPVVVRILVVVAGNLLLLGALGVGLYVGMQQATAIAHVLQCSPRTIGDFQRTVLADLGASQVRLEK